MPLFSLMLMLRCCSCDIRKLPTNSHISASSYLPIVTSNRVLFFPWLVFMNKYGVFGMNDDVAFFSRDVIV